MSKRAGYFDIPLPQGDPLCIPVPLHSQKDRDEVEREADGPVSGSRCDASGRYEFEVE